MPMQLPLLMQHAGAAAARVGRAVGAVALVLADEHAAVATWQEPSGWQHAPEAAG